MNQEKLAEFRTIRGDDSKETDQEKATASLHILEDGAHNFTTEAIAEKFSLSLQDGLSERQVLESRRQFGKNSFTRQKGPSVWQRIWHAACEPMLVILLVAAAVTFGVNLIRFAGGSEADFIECAGILVAIVLAIAITVLMEGRSQKTFEALRKIQDNIAIKVLRDGAVALVAQKELVVGDVVYLETGDKIPADCRLVSSSAFLVNEASLTGESLPVRKNADTVFNSTTDTVPLAERCNMVYCGCYVTMGNATAIVCAVGDATELGKIAGELGNVGAKSTPLQEKLDRLGKTITILGVLMAVLVFGIQAVQMILSDSATPDGIAEIFITSIVLIVAAVPEGLPTIVAMSLALNVMKMAKENALVKKMIACETVGCVNVICSDKTGTLTQNRMTMTGYYDGTWHDDVAELDSPWLIHNICLNTTADIHEDGSFMGNPTECAMLVAYEKSDERRKNGNSYDAERADHDTLHAFPFSSELKHMTTISKVDEQIISYVKGSPERVLAMCDVPDEKRREIEGYIAKAQGRAMRIIAFGHKVLHGMADYEEEKAHAQMESHMTFDGFVAIEDPLRPEVLDAVKTCGIAGITLKILTGDHLVTARAIADQLGILDSGKRVVTAAEIEKMDDSTLSRELDDIAVIARSTPGTKLRVVNLLRAHGNVVAVTGDGVNDAPAIKRADVGIAMGIAGTEVSREAADIVLMDDSFATIARAVRWGRGIYQNFQRFMVFQLTVNVSAVLSVLCSIIMGLASPFGALQLLWINIIMDGPPALTLGLEPLRRNLMTEKPVDRAAPIVTKSMWLRIASMGLLITLLFLVQTFFHVLGGTPEQQGSILFTLFVIMHLFNAFNCRETGLDSIFKNFVNNKIMLIVFAVVFVLQIVITQFGGSVFQTVPLEFAIWVKIVLYSLFVVAVSEVVKIFLRRMNSAC